LFYCTTFIQDDWTTVSSGVGQGGPLPLLPSIQPNDFGYNILVHTKPYTVAASRVFLSQMITNATVAYVVWHTLL